MKTMKSHAEFILKRKLLEKPFERKENRLANQKWVQELN